MVEAMEIETSYIRKYGDYQLPIAGRKFENTVKGRPIHRYESTDSGLLDDFNRKKTGLISSDKNYKAHLELLVNRQTPEMDALYD